MLAPDLAESLSSNPLVALPVVFASGVLTSFTPCIYPMIPMTAAIVGGQANNASLSRARVVALTAAYVVGLALVYSLLGLIAGMSGTMFGAVSSNPWMSFVMANLLIAFALMMLEVIPVPVPQRLIQRAAQVGRGGHIGGTFLMGAASGLVAAPCGAPVMGSVLTWVASTRSGALGFLYLFAFSLGMCAVLVAVGLSAGAVGRLPRAGMWMVWVKRIFAAAMLGVAEFYLFTMGQLLI
jgi:thiol:disulfide interchange protein DsbD